MGLKSDSLTRLFTSFTLMVNTDVSVPVHHWTPRALYVGKASNSHQCKCSTVFGDDLLWLCSAVFLSVNVAQLGDDIAPKRPCTLPGFPLGLLEASIKTNAES